MIGASFFIFLLNFIIENRKYNLVPYIALEKQKNANIIGASKAQIKICFQFSKKNILNIRGTTVNVLGIRKQLCN